MRTVDNSVGEGLMFIRFAKLTQRFENGDIVVSTKEIAESYQERQTKDGELDTALATIVGDLRMCIWEANYTDWLATVIHRAKYSKFFSEPSKATKLQARHLSQVASGRLDLEAAILGLEREQDSQANLFRRACAHLNQPESAVFEAIRQCIDKKASKDANEILALEKTERWGELYGRILRDTRNLQECIPTRFIPFQEHVRGALREFTRAHSMGCARTARHGASYALAQKRSNENRHPMQTEEWTGAGAPMYGESRREMKENNQKVDARLAGRRFADGGESRLGVEIQD
ncbi:unnamed protein product [Tuber aestivum]|uniref:Uncharacterized protein n=1 Tax=Tuber aestivum TaxID=59557 RepID=A0A292PP87_9PEZI|nr:unnamed protein product [Tuber aestivum]